MNNALQTQTTFLPSVTFSNLFDFDFHTSFLTITCENQQVITCNDSDIATL